MIPKTTDIKHMVRPGYEAEFTRYFGGNLWYRVRYNHPERDAIQEFEFPVPIEDIGQATFYAKDKALLFMRYMRIHLFNINEAKLDQGDLS